MRVAMAAILLILAIAQGQPTVSIKVYPSGYVQVTYRTGVIALVPESFYEIGSPELITAYYTNGSPLPYVVQNGSITVEPPYNGTAIIRYYTESVVTKNSLGWFLNISTPYPITVQLPYNSSLIYINRVPSAISVTNNTIVLALGPGSWSIGYVLAPPAPVSVAAQEVQYWYYYAAVAAIAVAAVGALAGFIIVRRRRREAEVTRELDRQIIEYLKKHGGSAREGEIRQELVIPKTTEWRAIKRLEREGVVRVKRVGRENVVELLKG